MVLYRSMYRTYSNNPHVTYLLYIQHALYCNFRALTYLPYVGIYHTVSRVISVPTVPLIFMISWPETSGCAEPGYGRENSSARCSTMRCAAG